MCTSSFIFIPFFRFSYFQSARTDHLLAFLSSSTNILGETHHVQYVISATFILDMGKAKGLGKLQSGDDYSLRFTSLHCPLLLQCRVEWEGNPSPTSVWHINPLPLVSTGTLGRLDRWRRTHAPKIKMIDLMYIAVWKVSLIKGNLLGKWTTNPRFVYIRA